MQGGFLEVNWKRIEMASDRLQWQALNVVIDCAGIREDHFSFH
jgi:hypothetical protein